MREKTWSYNIIVFVSLSLITFFYFLIGHRFFLHRGLFDEGLAVYGATRILNGDIPYRDFWTLYTPCEFYLLATIFKFFGISIIVERITNIIIYTSITILIYLITIKISLPKKFIFLVWFMSVGWLRRMIFYSYGYSYMVAPSILFAILSCLALNRYFLIKKQRWAFISGILVGIVYLFRQDFGFYVFISGYLILFIFIYNNKNRKFLISIKESLFYVFGSFIVIFPIILYFLFNSAIFAFIQDTIIFPLSVYPKVRVLPFPKPSLDSIIFYFPLVIFIISSITLIGDFFSKRFRHNNQYLILLFLFLGIIFLNYPRIRTQIGYFMPSMLFAIILFIYLINRILEKVCFRKYIFCDFFIYGVVFIIAIYLFILPALFETRQFFMQSKTSSMLELPRAYGCYNWDNNTFYQQEAIKFIREHVSSDERIFVGNFRHDKVVYNDIMFYFLSERHSATKYYELHPGLTTTKEIQKEIIDDIKEANVRYIVLWGGNELVIEPNQSSRSSAVFLLDDFVQKNYKIEKTFGLYTILSRIY